MRVCVCFLSTQLTAWKKCFDMLLLPLLIDISQTDTLPPGHKAGDAKFDLRLRVSTLLFRVFLQRLPTLSALPDFHIFWLKFVGVLERHMKRTKTPDDSLSLHFTESLKNVLLVMYTSNVFQMASQRSGQDLSALTWSVIGSFRPDLRQQLEEACAGFIPALAAAVATNLP